MQELGRSGTTTKAIMLIAHLPAAFERVCQALAQECPQIVSKPDDRP